MTSIFCSTPNVEMDCELMDIFVDIWGVDCLKEMVQKPFSFSAVHSLQTVFFDKYKLCFDNSIYISTRDLNKLLRRNSYAKNLTAFDVPGLLLSIIHYLHSMYREIQNNT